MVCTVLPLGLVPGTNVWATTSQQGEEPCEPISVIPLPTDDITIPELPICPPDTPPPPDPPPSPPDCPFGFVLEDDRCVPVPPPPPTEPPCLELPKLHGLDPKLAAEWEEIKKTWELTGFTIC
jgi:hypothetical protein